MREHPLLMKGPLVRATLEGRKTQTRRPLRCLSNDEHMGKLLGDWHLSRPPYQYDGGRPLWRWKGKREPKAGDWVEKVQTDVDDTISVPVKGMPSVGDRLWVRETWDWRDWQSMANRKVRIAYAADGAQVDTIAPCDWNPVVYNAARWHPSIHMPRWACRLVLPLVSVRVERVQSISEEDAWAEGYGEHWQKRIWEAGADDPLGRPDPRGWFAMLWDKLYGTWRQNPWVAVYEWGQIEVVK